MPYLLLAGLVGFVAWMGWQGATIKPIDKTATRSLIERQGYGFRGWVSTKKPCGTATVVDATGAPGTLTYCPKDGGYDLSWRAER